MWRQKKGGGADNVSLQPGREGRVSHAAPHHMFVSCLCNLVSGLSCISTATATPTVEHQPRPDGQESPSVFDPSLQHEGRGSQSRTRHDEPDATASKSDSEITTVCGELLEGSEGPETPIIEGQPTSSGKSNERGAEGAFEPSIQGCRKRKHSTFVNGE